MSAASLRAPGGVIRLRVDQDGEVYRIVHEDSGKVLCAGSWEEIREWVEDPKKRQKTATLSEWLATADHANHGLAK